MESETHKNLTVKQFDESQIDLIKRTVAQGCTNDELKMFLYQAQRTGLDPLSRQIYIIKRKSRDAKGDWIEKAVIQTSIDGFRLTADRTQKYAPGDETFEFDKNGKLLSATAGVKKLVANTWHEVKATAYLDEYIQLKSNGEPTQAWTNMPRVMLSKCAESKALRKAFPAELSGLYTSEEMGPAETREEAPQALPIPNESEGIKEKIYREEAETNKVILYTTEKFKSFNESQRKTYEEITKKLFELCGTDGKLLEKVMRMCSEWRDKDTGEIKKEGVNTPIALSYTKSSEKAKMTQAQVALNKLNSLSRDNLQNALEVWGG